MSGRHSWRTNCSHGSWSAYAYGPLAGRLYWCEGQNCGQVSVVYPSSRDKDGQKIR